MMKPIPLTKKITTRAKLASWHLQQGGVIAYQSDTVIGLGCLVKNEAAIAKIIALKQRSYHKGLIIIAADIAQLMPYIDNRKITTALLTKMTINNDKTRAITWLIPVAKKCSVLIRGLHTTVACRLTSHEGVRYLCQSTNSALISTSANLAGLAVARNGLKLKLYFGSNIDFTLLNTSPLSEQPSQIKDLLTDKVYRA